MHDTIDSTVHSMPLTSLEHCICTTTVTNIHPDRHSNLVPPGYKPQSIQMSNRGRPIQIMNKKEKHFKCGNKQSVQVLYSTSSQSWSGSGCHMTRSANHRRLSVVFKLGDRIRDLGQTIYLHVIYLGPWMLDMCA